MKSLTQMSTSPADARSVFNPLTPTVARWVQAIKRWASECPDVKNYIWRLNPVWHRMLYSCAHMATEGVKGLRLRMIRRVDIVTVVVDVGRYVDGALIEVDRNIAEVWAGDQLKHAQVQLLGVRIRPLPYTHKYTSEMSKMSWRNIMVAILFDGRPIPYIAGHVTQHLAYN